MCRKGCCVGDVGDSGSKSLRSGSVGFGGFEEGSARSVCSSVFGARRVEGSIVVGDAWFGLGIEDVRDVGWLQRFGGGSWRFHWTIVVAERFGGEGR